MNIVFSMRRRESPLVVAGVNCPHSRSRTFESFSYGRLFFLPLRYRRHGVRFPDAMGQTHSRIDLIDALCFSHIRFFPRAHIAAVAAMVWRCVVLETSRAALARTDQRAWW